MTCKGGHIVLSLREIQVVQLPDQIECSKVGI